MKFSHVLLSLTFTALGCSASNKDKHFSVSASRKHGAAKKGTLKAAIADQLYWYGNFTVGDGTNLELLIDTASSDLLLNVGTYQPSKYMTAFDGNNTISTTFEGVDDQGFGVATVNASVLNDLVSAGGLTVTDQTIGNFTSVEYFDVPPDFSPHPGSGIVGFNFPANSKFQPPALPWFWNLCSQKLISACRFGLAFGTSGIGQIIVGKYAKDLITGPVVSLPNIGGDQVYAVSGDVTLNGSVILKDQTIVMDSGTNNIQAPIEQAQQLFKLLNYPTQLLTEAPTPFNPGVTLNILNGFFDCNDPPSLGFSFPAESQLQKGEKATVFEVSKDVWGVFKNSATNCTSILAGTNAVSTADMPLWLLGQPFFSGHYIDFSTNGCIENVSGNDTTINIAKLKHPDDGSAC